MALPSWYILTAGTIAADAKLDGDEYLGSSGARDAEIARRIPGAGEYVLGELRSAALTAGLISSFADDLSTVLTTGQQTLAVEAGRLLVIAALHGVLPGEPHRDVSQIATDGRNQSNTGQTRLGSAEAIITSLKNQLLALAQVQAGASNRAESIDVRREREDEQCGEYSRPAWRCWP